MNNDITDFSPRKSGEVNKNKSLYESALADADKQIYSFRESRKMKDLGNVSFKKTHNPSDFLDPKAMAKRNAARFNENTNATSELARLQETLMYGATEEDLEKEVQGSFGRELCELLINHGITGEAVSDALKCFEDIIGKEPNVQELLDNWQGGDDDDDGYVDDDGEDYSDEDYSEDDDSGDDEDYSDESEDEGGEEESDEGEEVQESVKYESMIRSLRKKIAENKIKNKAALKEAEFEDDYVEEEELTPAQIRDIVRKYPALVAPEFGGMRAGETRTLRDGTVVKATRDGTMTPQEVYAAEQRKKANLRDPALKSYEWMAGKGRDINSRGYRDDAFLR